MSSRYIVYRDGRVYSEWGNKFLKPFLRGKKLYLCYNLTINKKVRSIPVHRIVAETFILNPENYPIVRHLNDIVTDNRVENLSWGTQSDNLLDAKRNGRLVGRSVISGEKHYCAKLKMKQVLKIKKLLKTKVSIKKIAQKYNVHVATISDIKHGRSWKNV